MGKYEATSQRAAAPAGGGKKKKHIGLWITLAVLAVVVCWGVCAMLFAICAVWPNVLI